MLFVACKQTIMMEDCRQSVPRVRKCLIVSFCSGSSQHQTSTPINTSIVTRHLRDRLSMLRSLRQGFIQQHGSEPSVSLRYSDQSTSNSTISLRVGGGYLDADAELEPSTSASSSCDQAKRINVSLCYSLGFSLI